MKRNHNKLVRDRIPDILNERGIAYGAHLLTSHEEMLVAIFDKVQEELDELHAAALDSTVDDPDPGHVLEELVDLTETVDALRVILGVDVDTLGDAMIAKRAERGGFEKGIFLDWTEENETEE